MASLGSCSTHHEPVMFLMTHHPHRQHASMNSFPSNLHVVSTVWHAKPTRLIAFMSWQYLKNF
jgi:hypothetical protein